MALNAYQTVTDRIVAMMEAGTAPWSRPWDSAKQARIGGAIARPLRSNGQPYRGANVLNLWAAGMLRGFSSRYWMTYKGAQELGGQVRKGAKSELAFYVGKHTVEAEKEGDDDKVIAFMRSYCVFNADEVDGLPARFYATAPPAPAPEAPRHARNTEIDTFVAELRADIAHGGDRAYYMPALDAVRIPHLDQFHDADSYYATLLHELTHWTSHDTRRPRELGKRFGDDAYAAEELVAELGAAFLCADLGISQGEPRADHASYIANWIRVLKNDNRAIFRAAALAEKAAAFMHAQQPASADEAAEAEAA